MLVMPAWAMLWQMFRPTHGWLAQQKYLLLTFGIIVQVLLVWIVVEAVLVWKKIRTTT